MNFSRPASERYRVSADEGEGRTEASMERSRDRGGTRLTLTEGPFSGPAIFSNLKLNVGSRCNQWQNLASTASEFQNQSYWFKVQELRFSAGSLHQRDNVYTTQSHEGQR